MHPVSLFPTPGMDWVEPMTRMEFVWIAPGSFNMGASPSDLAGPEYERPCHTVCIDHGYWIGRNLVTNRAYRLFRPGHDAVETLRCQYPDCDLSHLERKEFDRPMQPVVRVDWDDAEAFLDWLSLLHDMRIRFTLPTEEQWEYACRAGTSSPWPWGYGIECYHANFGNGAIEERCKGFNPGMTTDVGSYDPNGWGIYDMCGNVAEMCRDIYVDYAEKERMSDRMSLGLELVDAANTSRVMRNGGWNASGSRLRSSHRFKAYSHLSRLDLGFRACIGS